MSKPYTVETAEKTLPYVRAIVDEACDIYTEIRKKGNEHTRMDEARETERQNLRDEIRVGADRLRECCLEIEELGDGSVAVFLPSVPAVTLGQLQIVPVERVFPIPASLHTTIEALTMFGEGVSKLVEKGAPTDASVEIS